MPIACVLVDAVHGSEDLGRRRLEVSPVGGAAVGTGQRHLLRREVDVEGGRDERALVAGRRKNWVGMFHSGAAVVGHGVVHAVTERVVRLRGGIAVCVANSAVGTMNV